MATTGSDSRRYLGSDDLYLLYTHRRSSGGWEYVAIQGDVGPMWWDMDNTLVVKGDDGFYWGLKFSPEWVSNWPDFGHLHKEFELTRMYPHQVTSTVYKVVPPR